MDDNEKKTYGNTSSAYLSLKAELLRKQQDFQKASSSSTTTSSDAILDNLQATSSSLKIKTKADLDVEVANPPKKKKKSEEEPSNVPSSSTITREEEIALAKSRAILEAKSKLYEQIMSNSEMRVLAEDDGDDDENNKSFLVDFERKIYETNQSNPKVEYTDSFGRTRLVTPEEYEQLKAAIDDKRSSSSSSSKNTTEHEIDRVERLHREQMRSKWEAEMEALRNKTHVHYQDLLFDEKREHGVGFYKFSTDDQTRADQMATLNELRAKTKSEQERFQQEKDKRQVMMAEKLRKMKLRKAKELGIDLSDNKPRPEKITTVDNQNISNEKPAKEILEQPKSQPLETPTAKSTNSSIAYPFPILRTNPTVQSSDKH